MWFQNLTNFALSTKSKYILLAIVFLGFLMRANNLTIGFPLLFVSNDEAIYHLSALNMLSEKTPLTIGNYGPLGAYLQLPFLLIAFGVLILTGKVDSVSDMEFLLTTQEGYLLFIPRLISAMFGTLVILVIYKLTFELFRDKHAALFASFLSAVSFNLVHISHLARGWSGAIFFSLIAVLFAVRSIKCATSEIKNTNWAYVFAAIAFGFHQISGIVVILVILIRLFGKQNQIVSSFFSKINLSALGIWLFLIMLFNYLSLGDRLFNVISPTNTKVGLLQFPLKTSGASDLVKFYIEIGSLERVIKDLFLTDGFLVIFAFLFFFTKQNRLIINFVFLTFIIFNFALIATIFPPFLRYALVAIAFLPIFAGSALSTLVSKGKIPMISFMVILVFASLNSIYWNILLLKEPTFDQVRRWLESNISPQTPIAVTLRRNFGYVPIMYSSEPIRRINPSFYIRSAKLVGDKYPPNVRNVLYLSEFGKNNKLDNLNKGLSLYSFDYVVDSYLGSYDRLLYQKPEMFELLAHFPPTGGTVYDQKIPELLFDAPYIFPLFKVDRAGPYFDILKIIN